MWEREGGSVKSGEPEGEIGDRVKGDERRGLHVEGPIRGEMGCRGGVMAQDILFVGRVCTDAQVQFEEVDDLTS
jgi:hypothetical protein